MARSETDRVIAKLDDAVETIVSSLAINITAELIERTPVDTGWARANWVPQVGSPFLGNSQNYSREERLSDVGLQTGQQQTAIGGLFAYKIGRGAVFISNNVPYIGFLNDGSSQQAPSGFVTLAIVAGIRSLDSRRFE